LFICPTFTEKLGDICPAWVIMVRKNCYKLDKKNENIAEKLSYQTLVFFVNGCYTSVKQNKKLSASLTLA
jgi:hypothetical protein